MKKPKLDTRPARTDLTSRECAKLLGSLIGGMIEMASIETVRDAVRWWAETDEAWTIVKPPAPPPMQTTHELGKAWTPDPLTGSRCMHRFVFQATRRMGLVRVLARAGSYLQRIYVPTPSEAHARCDSGILPDGETDWGTPYDIWVLEPGEWLCVLVTQSDGQPPIGQFFES